MQICKTYRWTVSENGGNKKIMKYAVVYESATGNTKMLADEIINILGDAECVYFGTVEENIRNMTKEADIVFIGFWTDKGECSVGAAQYMETLRDRDVFLFGTAGFGGSPQYFSQILRRVSGCLPEGNTLAGTYMCQGKMPQSVRKRYEAMQEKNPQDEKVKMMIENYDRAQTHPDEEDLIHLREAVAEAVRPGI
jgi:flavodoxin